MYLIVPAAGGPFVLARKAIERIRAEAPQIDLEVFSGSRDLTAIFARRGLSSPAKAAFTLDATSYSAVMRFHQLLGQPEIADISWDIRTLRMAKSEAELAVQRGAGEVMAGIPDLISSGFRPGMMEIEMSAVMENYLRLRGHAALLRSRREGIEMAACGICSAGTNSLSGTKFDGVCGGAGISAAAPYGAGFNAIPERTPVIVDFALCYNDYHVDQTRMFSWGRPADEVLAAYDAMVGIERAIVENLRPGAVWEDLYNLSVEMAAESGYAEVFMGDGDEQVKFVGHGVGLELDEPPYLAPKMPDKLTAGMVLAIEPKVALPGVGIVGIEDTFIVREGQPERITTAPREFIVV